MTFKKKLLLIVLPLLMIAATPLASTRVQQALKEMITDTGIFDKVIFEEGPAEATPASGEGVVYTKTDGKLYHKNDAGTESDLTAGAGGGDPDQNLYETFTGDTGSTTASTIIDSFSIIGGTNVTTTVGTDTVTIDVVGGAGDVTAAANLGDNLLIRGDGAVKGVQNSGITINDSDVMSGVTSITGLTTPLSTAQGGTGATALTNLIALTTDTTGNYSDGNAEAGDALVSIAAEITDNEATVEENPMVFVAGADPDGGDLPLETDGTCTYNPSTGEITTTGFVGALTGNADTVTTNANLTGPITSVGNATSIASQTGTGSTFVVNTSPTLVTPVLGVATATTINKVTLTSPATAATITATDGTTTTLSGGTHSGTNTGDVAETNSLETVTTGIATTEIPIGTAVDTVVYAALSGDATMTNGGVVTVVDDSHNHVITNIDVFTKANLETQTSDVADYAEADGDVFTGVHDFGGATSIELVNSATPTTDATGEIALDTTITDHQPLWQYFDAAENMTIIAIDTAELPATDNEIIKYDAATDKFVLEADADSGGAPEGTAVLSTGEVGGNKFLREDGDGTSSWQAAVATHDGTITWTGTSILETGVAFQFGDASDATLTHTYANTGTNVDIAYSTAAMSVTGALTATNLSGTNTGDEAAASVTVAGISELATTAEIDAGTGVLVLSVAEFEDSDFAKKTVSLLLNASTDLTTGDGKIFFRLPDELAGWSITGVSAARSTGTGTDTYMIRNVTQAADVLSTILTMDANELDSNTAAVPAVIDTGQDDGTLFDRYAIDVDSVGSSTKFAEFQVTFERLP